MNNVIETFVASDGLKVNVVLRDTLSGKTFDVQDSNGTCYNIEPFRYATDAIREAKAITKRMDATTAKANEEFSRYLDFLEKAHP